ncbi:MAG: sodium-translocating pyrophosphatase [candidate division WOR-3 bacterium]
MEMAILIISAGLGAVGFLVAILTYFYIKSLPAGEGRMLEYAAAIRSGAFVFLRREYTYIGIFALIVAIVLAVFIKPIVGVAYITGAFLSLLAGFVGMAAATVANVRTTYTAYRTKNAGDTLSVAFKGGSVMGITVAALGLLGVALWLYFTKDPTVLSGFGMGASSVALFARVGGGIYTKAADVGADLVGKVEAGIPEDDPRNPAVIADNVGDNVGDTAGMGADLYESYVGSMVATVAIALAASFALKDQSLTFASLPVVLSAWGLISSLLGVWSIDLFKKADPQTALRNATIFAAALFIIGSYFINSLLVGYLGTWIAVVSGIIAGLLIGFESEYYTSGNPIKKIAESAQFGPATVIINGVAVAYESVVLPFITIALALLLGYFSAEIWGSPGLGIYGVSLAAVGMLATIGIVMTTDSYGPIADNAGGIAEMSHLGKEVRSITDKLDALGNTTAAIGKGFAIGSAALAALALLVAYKETVGLDKLDFSKVESVVGAFLGASMPALISALTLNAVGRAANKMVEEVRRQFRELRLLEDENAKPQYDKCIDIVTQAALKEMVLPGISAVLAPILVGLLFGTEALGFFLGASLLVGALIAIFMANGGGAWDNAKKYIEEGHFGGKGSDAHKAAVVGDTVGDPFKDTTGPSMNILIKLMSIVSLVFGPLLHKYGGILLKIFTR